MKQGVKVDSSMVLPEVTGIKMVIIPVSVNLLEIIQGLKGIRREEGSGVLLVTIVR